MRGRGRRVAALIAGVAALVTGAAVFPRGASSASPARPGPQPAPATTTTGTAAPSTTTAPPPSSTTTAPATTTTKPRPAPTTTATTAATTTTSTTSAAPPRSGTVRALVIGDSLADLLAQRLVPEAARYGVEVVDRAVWGCGVVRGGPYRYVGQVDEQMPKCDQWPDRWAADVAEVDPDVVVVLIGRWEVMDRVHDGRWMHLGDPDYDAYLLSELEAALPVLTGHGARIALCSAPYYHRDQPTPPNGAWPEDEPARVDRENQLFRQFAARHPDDVSIVDLGGRLSPQGHFTRVVDGVTVRAKDGVHLAPDIGRWSAPWFLPAVRDAAPPA